MPRRHAPAVLAAAVLTSVLLPGCTTSGPDEPSTTSACESLEACFEPDEMPAFLDEAVALVQGWARITYEGQADDVVPAEHVLVPRGETVPSDCAEMTEEDFAYCPADRTVYLGEATLWEFYSDQGDAAAVLALAHEWGHHLQELAGVPLDADDQATGIAVENQADCVAGAVQGYLIEEELFEDDDVDDVEALLTSIAESEDDPDREHGTFEERSDAWDLGSRGGVDACSTFFPDAPLR